MALRVAVRDPQKVSVRFPAAEVAQAVRVTLSNSTGVILSDAPATDETGGIWSYMLLPTHVAEVDRLSAAFTGQFDGIERGRIALVDVAGRHFFDVEDVRAMPDITASMTDAKIAEQRQNVEDQFEQNVGTPLVERYREVTLNGLDSTAGIWLRLPDPYVTRILGVTVAGVALDPGLFTLDGRYVAGSWPRGLRNVTVRYVAGLYEPPADLREAALIAVQDRLLRRQGTGADRRAIALTTEAGTMTLATAGLRNPTGIPEVDAVLLHWANELGEVL